MSRSSRKHIAVDTRPQTPPGFLRFFHGEFQRRLERVRIVGMEEDASWDRRAAYLLWKAEKHDHDD